MKRIELCNRNEIIRRKKILADYFDKCCEYLGNRDDFALRNSILYTKIVEDIVESSNLEPYIIKRGGVFMHSLEQMPKREIDYSKDFLEIIENSNNTEFLKMWHDFYVKLIKHLEIEVLERQTFQGFTKYIVKNIWYYFKLFLIPFFLINSIFQYLTSWLGKHLGRVVAIILQIPLYLGGIWGLLEAFEIDKIIIEFIKRMIV
jgi:hypothetical protein